jgi:hypothetical protein
MRRVKGILDWFGTNSATVIALSSLFVALLSLYFTIEAQNRDALYKELSIKPIVIVAANVSDFSFGYRNSGYGYGVARRVAFAFDGKCYSSDNNPINEFQAAYSKFMDATANKLYESILRVKLKPDVKGFHVTQQSLDAGFPIRPGEVFLTFFLEDSSRDALLKADGASLNQARAEFRRVASHIPLNVTFCSATGLSCDVIATEDETCQ